MKLPVLICALLIAATSAAQEPVFKVFSSRLPEGGYRLVAANPEWYPVSVRFEFDNTGLLFSEGSRMQFVVPPRTDSFRIGDLGVAPGAKRWAIKYRYVSAMGDVALKTWDRDYVYDLPFGKGPGYTLYQGYNGAFSHANENALDFTMPEGTPVTAAREGIVVKVVQHNDRSCTSSDCKQFNNYVILMHGDGTFAYYGHIRKDGAAVKPGATVRKGDVIAYSGNTGWSNGPHLHLAIFAGGFDNWRTLATRFRTGRGGDGALLREGSTYSRDY